MSVDRLPGKYQLYLPNQYPDTPSEVAATFRTVLEKFNDLPYLGDGTYTTYTPSWTVNTGTAPAIGNGTLTGRYFSLGDSFDYRIYLKAGSTTTFGSGGFWIFSLPFTVYDPAGFGANPSLDYCGWKAWDNSGLAHYSGPGIVQATTCTPTIQTTTALDINGITNASIFPWATSDTLVVSGRALIA